MADKTVAEKARVKPGTTFAVLNEAPGVVVALGLPEDTAFVDPGEAQVVLLFVNSRAELEALVLTTIADLRLGQDIWIFFRKGSKAAGLDMNRDDVWAIAERAGMRPLGLLGVDEVWSVFRLRQGR